MTDINEALEDLGTALDALEAIQWKNEYAGPLIPACPMRTCERSWERGHAPTCAIGALLRKYGKHTRIQGDA